MIKIYLQNLAKVIDKYYDGNKDFDVALDNNERLLRKLASRIYSSDQYTHCGGNIDELRASVQKLIQINATQEAMINQALGNDGTEYKNVKLFGDINETLAIGKRLVEYLGVLKTMVNDEKLSRMSDQLTTINNILDAQLA